MTLDATAREANLKDSVKKYIIDNLGSYCPITFDRSLEAPRLQGRAVTKWISVLFGYINREYMSEAMIDIYCATRQDNEGFKNAQLCDNVMGVLTDTTYPHGMAMIPFYQSHPTDPWTLIGGILVQDVRESRVMTTEDETKYKILTARLRFASKI